MTSFFGTTFICSSVRATLTIFSMTSALAQMLNNRKKMSKYKFCSSVWVNKENLSKYSEHLTRLASGLSK